MSGVLAATVVAASLRLVAAHGYAEGAPPGFSGGFTEPSCHACHFDAEPNPEHGGLTIEGVPAEFVPGERHAVTVTLKRAAMARGGFQLAARFADDGAQAGTIEPGPADGERVRVETQAGVQYANQKTGGTAVDADAVAWTIVWTAPTRAAPVVFHVSANAGNGNESADGDFVYTATMESVPRPAASPPGSSAGGERHGRP